MRITCASVSAPAGVNEDRYRVGGNWALVIDGAGRYPGRDGGCIHPVTWLVNRLADHVEEQLNSGLDAPLVDVARSAIQATMTDHGPTCDLTDPLSPGAALAIVRVESELTEWLVLGDCAVAFDQFDAEPFVVVDDRVDRLSNAPVTDTAVRTYHPDHVATVRNRPGGFWVAGAVPEAADHALTGTLSSEIVHRILVCSDGVTRLTERHGWTWRDMFTTATDAHLGALIAAVRDADAADPDPRRWRGKLHDDATVVLMQPADDEGA